MTIVVVPGELHRSAAKILLAVLVWPGVIGPVVGLVITAWVIRAVAADLLHPVETLLPEVQPGVPVPLTSLLAPVSENSRKLSFASLIEVQV